MKYFLFIALIFLISTKLYAESGGGRFVKIEDLDVAGIKVGDTALSYYSKSKLLETKYDWFEPVYTVSGLIEKRDMYDEIQIIYKSGDNDYKIEALSALQYMEGKKCKRQLDDRIQEIKEYYGKAIRLGRKSTFKHRSDSSGKSKSYNTKYTFDNGDIIFIACYDWSEETGKGDHFRYGILSNEFAEWVRGAHK